MSKLYDIISNLDDLTNDLDAAAIILQTVCENYFDKNAKATDPATLYGQYNTFSTLVYTANRMLWDVVDKYRKISDEFTDYNSVIEKLVEKVGAE